MGNRSTEAIGVWFGVRGEIGEMADTGLSVFRRVKVVASENLRFTHLTNFYIFV